MKTLSMKDLLTILTDNGYKARYEMTGGNNGTISFDFTDEKGDVWISIGPSDFSTGTANSEELCIEVHEEESGEDGMTEDRLIYWNQEQHGDFTAVNIAQAAFDQITD